MPSPAHHVDVAAEQIGRERRGILDMAQHDALKARRRAGPMRVRRQHDLRAAVIGGDHVGAVVQPRIDRGAVVARGFDIRAGGRGLCRDRPLDMLRQDLVPLVVVRADLAEMQHRRVRIHHIHRDRTAPWIGVGKAARRVAPQLPGEGDVAGGDGGAVAPLQARLQLDRDRHALRAIRPVLDLGQAVLQRRQLRAQQAGVLPRRVEGRDRAQHEPHHVGAHDLRIDVGMQAGRELGDADGERVVRPLRLRRRAPQGEQNGQPGETLHREPCLVFAR